MLAIVANITVSKQIQMNIENFLVQVAVIACGGILIVAAAYFLVKKDIQLYFKLKQSATQNTPQAALLPLRLQAHERLILFIDRINPSNLLLRLHQPGLNLVALQTLALKEINSEYQHNITQQLYINTLTWKVIQQLKEDTVVMLNTAVQGLPPTAEGIDLSRKILQHLSTIANNPFELATQLLKKEIHSLF